MTAHTASRPEKQAMKPCSTCCYWSAGECRRFPTAVPTTPEYWCGEHARLGTHWQKFLADPVTAVLMLSCLAVFALTLVRLAHLSIPW